MMNSWKNNVNLHKEAVKAPLAPTFCQSTVCACGTTVGNHKRLLEELKSSSQCCKQEQPGIGVNQHIWAPKQSYILDDDVPSRTGLWKTPSSFPPTTGSLHTTLLFSDFQIIGVNICLHPPGIYGRRGGIAKPFPVNGQADLLHLFVLLPESRH